MQLTTRPSRLRKRLCVVTRRSVQLRGNRGRGGHAMELGLSAFIKTVMASLVYSFVGVAVFALCFLVIKLVVPFSIRKEIEEDHNTALAIVIGSVILGISLIISAAIHG